MRGVPKDLKKLFKEIKSHGWRVSRRNNGHFLLQGPNDQKVYCGGTPSDHRAIKNIKKDLSKAGLDLR